MLALICTLTPFSIRQFCFSILLCSLELLSKCEQQTQIFLDSSYFYEVRVSFYIKGSIICRVVFNLLSWSLNCLHAHFSRWNVVIVEPVGKKMLNSRVCGCNLQLYWVDKMTLWQSYFHCLHSREKDVISFTN